MSEYKKFDSIEEEYKSLLNIFAKPSVDISYSKEAGFDVNIKAKTNLQSVSDLNYDVYIITKAEFIVKGTNVSHQYLLAYRLSVDEMEVINFDSEKLDSLSLKIDSDNYDKALGNMLKTTASWLYMKRGLFEVDQKDKAMRNGIYAMGNYFEDSSLFGVIVKARVKISEQDKAGLFYTIPNNSGVKIVETDSEQTRYDALIAKDEAYVIEQEMTTLYGDLSKNDLYAKLDGLVKESRVEDRGRLGIYKDNTYETFRGIEKDFGDSQGVNGK